MLQQLSSMVWGGRLPGSEEPESGRAHWDSRHGADRSLEELDTARHPRCGPVAAVALPPRRLCLAHCAHRPAPPCAANKAGYCPRAVCKCSRQPASRRRLSA